MPSTYIDGNFVSYANCEDDGQVVEAQESGADGDSATDSAADEGAAAGAGSSDEDGILVDPCACVDENGIPRNDDGTVTFPVNGEEFFYPGDLGTMCAAWDMDQPFCDNLSDDDNYCNDSWCYVSPECPVQDATQAALNPDLNFSYVVCQEFDGADEMDEATDATDEGDAAATDEGDAAASGAADDMMCECL